MYDLGAQAAHDHQAILVEEQVVELGEHERDRHHWCFGRWQLGLRIILISQQIGRDNRHSLAGWLAYHQLIAHHLLACILRAKHEWPSKDSNLYKRRRVHSCNVSEWPIANCHVASGVPSNQAQLVGRPWLDGA